MTNDSKTGNDYHPWSTYIYAREEARRRGDRKVGTEHLVLGLVREPPLAAALDCDLQAARDGLDALDGQALAAIGLVPSFDAPPVRTRATPAKPTLKAVLRDRLPLTPAAKSALRDSGRPMRRGRRIAPQQVLMSLLALEPPDPAAELFAALGVDPAAVRQRLENPQSTS